MKNVSVKFVHTGGHGILLAKQNGYPTLTDNHLKFTDTSLNATASDTYDVDTDSLADGELILALFNVDYPVQGDLQFELLIIGRVNFHWSLPVNIVPLAFVADLEICSLYYW